MFETLDSYQSIETLKTNYANGQEILTGLISGVAVTLSPLYPPPSPTFSIHEATD